MSIPGGEAGHTIAPMATAGCYAPGGRYRCRPPCS